MLINLFPWREKNEKEKARIFLGHCIAVLTLSIILCTMFYVYILRAQSLQKKEITSLEKIAHSLPYRFDRRFVEYMSTSSGSKKFNLLEEKIDGDKLFFEALIVLSQEMPSTLYLNKILKNETNIDLYGGAISQTEVVSFVKLLGHKFSDKKIWIDEINRSEDEEYGAEFVVKFKII